jgi:putative DNA primase/helicase
VNTSPTTKNASSAWHAKAKELAAWALTRYFGRFDRYGGYYREDDNTKPINKPSDGLLANCVNVKLLERHFRATGTDDIVGAHTLNTDDVGKYIGIDIDAHDDTEFNPEQNLRLAKAVYADLVKLGFQPLMYESNGKGGYHIVVFFSGTISGSILFRFARWLIREYESYGFVKPPETFPKQEAIGGEFGNWMRCVGRHHKREFWPRVWNGSDWLEGEMAVQHILSLTGDSTHLIPKEGRKPAAEKKPAVTSSPASSKKVASYHDSPDVFKAYNESRTVAEVAGWHEAHRHTVISRTTNRVEFCRDGKTGKAHSFNVEMIDGCPITYNFSDNAGLPANRGRNPTQVRCFYQYGNCDTESMKELAVVLRKELGWPEPDYHRNNGKAAARNAPTVEGDGSHTDDEDKAYESLFPLSETDIANGRQFVDDHGENVRFVADMNRWFVFDGKRWTLDESETLVQALAKETAIRMGNESAKRVSEAARQLAECGDNDGAKDAANKRLKQATADLKHAKRTQDIRDIKRMLESAKSEQAVNIQKYRLVFDLHNHLFNAWNGTINLRDGLLRDFCREDYLTRVCPTSYRQDAPRGEYQNFLKKNFSGMPEVAEYIRKLSGYVATGETCDHSFHIFHGDGSNGKGVITLLWTHVLGEDEYAHTAPSTLLVNDGEHRHPTEKTGLRGARLVICSESKQGARLDEATVKNNTSDDTISARGMGQNFYRFPQTHKFVLQTNHRPHIRGTDHGIRRRLRLVPFLVQFWKESERLLNPAGIWPPELEADPTLLDRLKETESEGILADMIHQAFDFYKNGKKLIAPTEVMEATAEYLKNEDIIGQFFDERIEPNDLSITATTFYAEFKKWWSESGHKEKLIPSPTSFGNEAKKRFRHHKPKCVEYYVRFI